MTATCASAWGRGLATLSEPGDRVLDAYFPGRGWGSTTPRRRGPGTTIPTCAAGELAARRPGDDRQGPSSCAVASTVIDDLSAAPTDAYDAYLRLHLLSHRLVRPHEINLDGVFGVLPQRRLDDAGPVDVERARGRAPAGARVAGIDARGALGVDKFPRMTDYVVPAGVRIADADRVRLGAHLAAGTTVMHEGFVNFNAGTLGASMVEGRISAGASWSATAPTSAAARRSWARCRAAARR